jgi:hypothetical protein
MSDYFERICLEGGRIGAMRYTSNFIIALVDKDSCERVLVRWGQTSGC